MHAHRGRGSRRGNRREAGDDWGKQQHNGQNERRKPAHLRNARKVEYCRHRTITCGFRVTAFRDRLFRASGRGRRGRLLTGLGARSGSTVASQAFGLPCARCANGFEDSARRFTSFAVARSHAWRGELPPRSGDGVRAECMGYEQRYKPSCRETVEFCVEYFSHA